MVSYGIVGGVRSIPRKAWRIAFLAIAAAAVIALAVWSCAALYRITSTPPAPEPADVEIQTQAAETRKPSDGEVKKQQPAKAAPAKKPEKPAKPAQPKAAPAKPRALHSTGDAVPDLYID